MIDPMRTATTLLVTLGLVASLAACSTPPAAVDDAVADGCTASGPSSDAVKVTGDLGEAPDVAFTAGLTAEATERTVVIEGDGDTVATGDTVKVQYSIINGTTGEAVASTDYTDATLTAFPVDDEQFLPGIVRTLACSTVGSRVVGVIPPVDAFGAEGSTQLGIGADESMVFVADIVSINPPVVPPLPKADGVDQPVVDGFPTVVLADDGRPTVTIPSTAPPADYMLSVLKLGDGATVAGGDDVVVHYEGINWNTGVIFDESWARGTPSTFNTNAVIAGFTQALVGQKVGSQVIVIIPPDLGYGPDGGREPDISATDTLVFVIDILGIA